MNTIGEKSIYTTKIYNKIIEIKEHEILLYEDIFNEINKTKAEAYYYLSSAIKMVEKEGIHIDIIRGQGIKRITDEEHVLLISTKGICKMKKNAQRTIRKLTNIENFENLSTEAKTQHNMTLSLMGASLALTKPKNTKKIKDKINNTNKSIPHTAVFALLD